MKSTECAIILFKHFEYCIGFEISCYRLNEEQTVIINMKYKGNSMKRLYLTLFLRTNKIRIRPSHSAKSTGGGGLRGSSRTTEDSTCGGGRKLFLLI